MVIDINYFSNKVHFPVLIREIMVNLNLNSQNPSIILDCTFGAGGYTNEILKNYINSKVIALDRDKNVLNFVNETSKIYANRFVFHNTTFSNFPSVLKKENIKELDAIVMDIGFSTMQLEDEGRGFSFKNNNSISMEMGLNTRNAYNLVNKEKEDTLADIIYYYGEETKARKIAKAIVNYRKIKSIETSKELADIIVKCLKINKKQKTHPATKTFQAFRIYINDELEELQKALENSMNYLKKGGRLLVVSFHSLEDRIVKNFFKKNNSFTNCKQNSYTINLINKKPIIAMDDELRLNPKSSSAKLRVIQKD